MIVTRHLTLVPPSDRSIPIVVKWLNDPTIVRYSEQRHRQHSAVFQKSYIEMMAQHKHKYMEIHLGEVVIGTISARIDHHNDIADVGILIGEKNLWGKGYGAEAWQAFCDHLLGNGIRKIEAGCVDANLGMLHIFRKTGMHYEGRRTAHFLLGEDTHDMIMYGRFQ